MNDDFINSFQSSIGQNLNLCYQCRKCAVGCPIVYEMDYTPAQIVMAIRLGMKDLVLKSKTIWLCTSCETCTTRCPQDIEITDIMDTARKIAVREKVVPVNGDIRNFYRSFAQIIKIFGRMYEFGVIVLFKLRNREFKRDLGVGLKLLKYGKLSLLPNLGKAFQTEKMFSKVKKIEEENK